MTFGEALDLMRKGKFVARRSSPDFAKNAGIGIYANAWIRRLHPDGSWSASSDMAVDDDDLLASDWEVVDNRPTMSPSQ